MCAAKKYSNPRLNTSLPRFPHACPRMFLSGAALRASAHRNAKTSAVLISQDVKVKRDLKDFTFFYAALVSGGVILCFTFVFLWSRMTVVKLGYEISKANSASGALTEKRSRLKFEYEKLKSPERVEKIAMNELGLIYPTGERIINLR